jgi:hypothetical protein
MSGGDFDQGDSGGPGYSGSVAVGVLHGKTLSGGEWHALYTPARYAEILLSVTIKR